MKQPLYSAIVLGDSTNNTLSIVRSLGEAKIEQTLILKCDEDICLVAKSKYLKNSRVYRISTIEDCMPILEQLKENTTKQQTIICSFDEAAVFIDKKESILAPFFRTPARGKQIGMLFNKDEQCKLAEKCGLTVPKSIIFHREEKINNLIFDYPILLKPLNSTKGEKSDIHICQNEEEVENALNAESSCSDFILQEFIDKEYEIDCIGVRTEKETFLAGGIRKIRHYPQLIGAGAYGLFKPIREYNINIQGIEEFLIQANYYGPFSIEFLHKADKDYFMEVNFRNEGLAYAATSAVANLHALYLNPNMKIKRNKIHKVYMMNYSLDFLYVKNGSLSLWIWIRDLLRTRCFININFKDLQPTIHYYKNKITSKFTTNK